MTQNEVLNLYNQARESFVSQRMKQEMQINAWAEKLAVVDPEVLAGVELPKEITLKALVPELYADDPKQEIYDKQYADACALFEKINKIVEEYNKEALRCLSEYRELSSGQN